MNRLKNKTAFITGGSRGIGAGIAKRLAAEGAGVVITYVNAAHKAQQVVGDIQKAGGRAMAIAADNALPESITTAIEQAAAHFGGIDILVSNAGIFTLKPLDAYSLNDYDAMMAVNVRAVFVAVQAAARYMKSGGRVITIGSNMAERVTAANGTLYAMSKSALTGLTKGMARDLGPKGITVNLVQPGPVDTDMNPATSAHADHVRNAMAIPQYGTPADIAALVAYVASDESRFLTGASITIDGGFSI